MFRRTLNVPLHGGEGTQDNSMYTFACRYINKEIQDILQSDQVQNIINSSVSKEEAQNKINAFLK